MNAAHRMFHFLDEKAILLTMTAFDTDNKHHKSNRDNTCYVISTYCKREGYMIDELVQLLKTTIINVKQRISYLESPGDARCIEKQVARPVFKIAIFLVIFNLLSRRPVA